VLKAALETLAADTEHLGNTAVPNLAAKSTRDSLPATIERLGACFSMLLCLLELPEARIDGQNLVRVCLRRRIRIAR